MAMRVRKLSIHLRPWIAQRLRLGILVLVLVVGLGLLAIGGYFWWQKGGKLPEFNVGPYLQKLSAGLLSIVDQKKEEEEKEEVKPEELEITLPGPAVKIYEKTAETGEGVTHLAREALKDYLNEKGSDLNLTSEHKIYIEDYIKDRTGERWLKVGETLTFSEELITEAIKKAQELTPHQLENLKQYSRLVSSF